MRFNDDNVDIDGEIIDHLGKNELVVFVGAGVSSRAYPNQRENTYYPTFKQLVREIAKRLERKLSEQENTLLKQGYSDRVLGEWEGDGDDVYSIAAGILSENEDGQRIDLHQAIIRLFPEGSEARVVTTNFDNLLLRALEKEGHGGDPKWNCYEAPSLPPANRDRFQGICFLHGRVNTPKEMILTDKDIGRAYMDEGWALRFAHNLFRNFNVLFVGYSLEDPPLRYLSLALEGTNEKKHWALLPSEPNEKKRENLTRDWKRRGVTPIWFPVKRQDFRSLERTISDWAKDNRRGYIDKKNLLSAWASNDPIQVPPFLIDRVSYFLQTPELLRDFAGNDLNENWFDKLVEWGHFDCILKSSGTPNHSDSALLQKLIDWLIRNPEKWMVKLAPYRRTINIFLVEEFCRHVAKTSGSNKIEVDCLRKLIEFFRPVIEKDPSMAFSYSAGELLKQFVGKGYIDDAVWIFGVMARAETTVTTTPNFYYELAKQSGQDVGETLPLRLEFDVDSKSSRYYHLRNYVKHIFLPNIKTIGYPLLITLTNQFLDLRKALKRAGKGLYTYMWRKAIEEQEEDKHLKQNPEHFFIDALRDLWEALLIQVPDQASKIYELWCEIDDVYFRRISLHAGRKILERGNAD